LFHAAVVAAAGCGGGGGDTPTGPLDMGGPDGSAIAVLIEDLNDAKSTPKKAEAFFVKGVKPAEPKRFAQLSYYVVGKPSVSGATATCRVRSDDPGGTQVGETEWSFEKDGDKWKIKAAPLPK
jgi:ketosteroid isomerase-like protein